MELLKFIGYVPTIENDLTKDLLDNYNAKTEPNEPMKYPPVRITTINDQHSPKQNPYKTTYEKRLIIERQVQEWYDKGIIEPTKASGPSPVLIVSKKTGDWRVCVDYRELNKLTKTDAYPLPNIEHEFPRIAKDKPKYFCTVDLKGGFHQMTIHPDDREKTAFVTEFTYMHFRRFPFGLKNGSSLFQRAMYEVTRDLYFEMPLRCFIDDLYLWASEIVELLQCTERLLERFIERSIIIGTDKCHWIMPSVDLLGYRLDAEGRRPLGKNSRTINDLHRPQNK